LDLESLLPRQIQRRLKLIDNGTPVDETLLKGLPAHMRNLSRRIAALEAKLARRSGGLDVLEKINLPAAERQIVQRAIQEGFVMIDPEGAERVDAAINALPLPDRQRVFQLMEGSRLVVISGSDANL
jgi:hypothetical protein